jgi:UDP-N-acetylmuramoyl-L-alanyl-D-glutamate--2,6-diaminopimelate ligase
MSHDTPRDPATTTHLGVRLSDLAREIPGAHLSGDPSPLVTGVHHDSREVAPGDLFVARAGAKAHGLAFLDAALARGAVAVLVERGSLDRRLSVPVIEVDDVPRALAFASAATYGHPTFGLDVVGLTGTNGKTTTSQLVASCIEASGGRPGVIGTLGHRFEGFFKESKHTSPEADEISRIAAEMKRRGATHLVMEVSSIALAAARCDAVRFRVAAFTNLTQDHLDYHGTMEAYAEAKARLFVDLGPSSAAINVDDPFGRELARRVVYGMRTARYSAKLDASKSEVEVAPIRVTHEARGITMQVRTPLGEVAIDSPLVGAHNVENLLCAIAVATLLDLGPAAIEGGLSKPTSVAGRLERCDDPTADDVVVLVDYAHTPDALSRVLESVRPLARGSVTCVFGCGGDRDPHKRPLMGAAVGKGADRAIVTNDNPRSESPEAIAAQILPGLAPHQKPYTVELDRARAIHDAVLSAEPGDVILVAGKGHETYQIIGRVTHDFDDRQVAREALALRRARRAS